MSPHNSLGKCSLELVPTSLDKVSKDRLLAERLTCLEAMQALNQNKSLAVSTDQDRRCLALVQDTLGQLSDFDRVKRRPALCRHIDARRPKRFRFQHG